MKVARQTQRACLSCNRSPAGLAYRDTPAIFRRETRMQKSIVMGRSSHVGSVTSAAVFVIAALFALAMAPAALAAPFINLDFEDATVSPGANPMFGFLPWETA